ncbi:MAG: hypothetical protein AAGA26_08935 [Pseudomonadota bacterium]
MDDAVWGWIGGGAGVVFGLAGAVFGCWRAWRRTETNVQRGFLRFLYIRLDIGTAAFLTLILAVGAGLLPQWDHWLVILAIFIPLPFMIHRLNQRLFKLGPTDRGSA